MWLQVIGYEDRGYYAGGGNCTTDACCVGLCDGCPPGWNCGNWDCSPFPIFICYPCTRNRCEVQYWVSVYWTLYRQQQWRYHAWQPIGDVWRQGYFAS